MPTTTMIDVNVPNVFVKWIPLIVDVLDTWASLLLKVTLQLPAAKEMQEPYI